ncbi:MAG TPA: salicylate synthase [Terriglobales bacterium]|nr:salicylate synthase [Terriglobales bacterium]
MLTNHQLFLPGAVDDRGAVLALVGSGLFDTYVTYERPGTRWFAAGVLADVVMERERVRTAIGGRACSVELGSSPLRQLGEALASLGLPEYRAFGYLAFEAGHLVHGTGRLRSAGPPLAHLIVPEVEVRWNAAGTAVRGPSADLVRLVSDVLLTERELPELAATGVELSGGGSRELYERSVGQVLGVIRRGALRKAIVSRRVDVPFEVDLPRSYLLGLSLNTPARSFLMDVGGRRMAGFSPEVTAEVLPDGEVMTQPLAGTRPLRHLTEEDERLGDELAWDVKECYEHVISARLAHAEMREVCRHGSAAVRELMAVRRRGSVQHLASVVTGTLAPDRSPWDALAALFPSVTASGLPKRAALEAIADAEEGERELYGGVACVADSAGGLDAALVLRSIFQRGDETWLQAGAGIVPGSDPGTEFEETTSKLRSVAGGLVAMRDAAVAVAQGGRR